MMCEIFPWVKVQLYLILIFLKSLEGVYILAFQREVVGISAKKYKEEKTVEIWHFNVFMNNLMFFNIIFGKV